MKRIASILLFLIAFSAEAQQNSWDSLCQNIDKIGGIASQVTPTLWPSVTPLPPYGGVVIGATQNTSAIVDMCQFVNTLSTGNVEQKVMGSKQYLNSLTGRKFDDDFTFMDQTYNYANTLYDFQSGQRRQGSMFSAQSNRDLNDYVRNTRDYLDRKNRSEADDIRNSEQQVMANKMFTDLVAENANLRSAMNCPNPQNNPKYADLYEKNVQPQEERRRNAVRDSNFYRYQLIEMGKAMFLNEEISLFQYIEEINKIEEMGVAQSLTKGTYTEETWKPSAQVDRKGHVVKQKVILTKNYQVFSAKVYEDVFQNIRNRWTEKWLSFVKWTYLTNSTQFGVLAGAKERVERTFRNFNYECSEEKLMGNMEASRFDYEKIFKERREDCEKNTTVDGKEAENLFQFYVAKYRNSLFQLKDANSKIWTFESRYLGTTRFVTKDNSQGDFTGENVKCSEDLTIAEMDALSLKMKENENAMREQLLQGQMQKNIRKTQQKEQESLARKEEKRRMDYINNRQKEQEKSDRMETNIVAPRGGIGN